MTKKQGYDLNDIYDAIIDLRQHVDEKIPKIIIDKSPIDKPPPFLMHRLHVRSIIHAWLSSFKAEGLPANIEVITDKIADQILPKND